MDLSVVGPMCPVRRAVFRERISVVTESARAHGRRIVEADDGQVILISLKGVGVRAPCDRHQRDQEVPVA